MVALGRLRRLIMTATVLSAVPHTPSVYRPEVWDAFVAVVILLFSGMGALIAGRQPRNPIGWILCMAGLGWSVAKLAVAYAVYALQVHQGPLPAAHWSAWVGSWAWAPGLGLCVTYLFLLFPDGRLPSRRWRWLASFAAVAVAAVVVGYMLAAGPLNPLRYAANLRSFAHGPLFDQLMKYGWVALASSAVASAASLIIRYRQSRGEARQQLKWFGTGAGAAALSLVAATLIGGSWGNAGNLLGLPWVL